MKVNTKQWYSDQQKIEAVKLWLISGNLKATAAALNISYLTVRDWRYAKWWEELVTEIRTENNFTLSNKLKKVAEKAIEVTLDRLEYGDWIYDQKTGSMVRKPVVMRDAVLVANGFLDRQSRIEAQPMVEANVQKTQDRLAALAEAFSKFASKTKRVEVFDAVYDERKTGLQEGSGLGEDPSPPQIEGPDRESDSPPASGETRDGI